MEEEYIGKNKDLAFDHLYFLVGRQIVVEDSWHKLVKGKPEMPFTERYYRFRMGKTNVKLLMFENLEKIIIN
jgi:hypothetical protein